MHAFWPGLEASMGFTESAGKQLNSLMALWRSLGFLPEEIDQIEWLSNSASAATPYYLRPELIEGVYYQYRTTRDRSWLVAGEEFLASFRQTRTGCGFAAVAKLQSTELLDSMPSFFLSETLKYLYLLFDEDNFMHDRAFIFSTEAHPFDLRQNFPALPVISGKSKEKTISNAETGMNILDFFIGKVSKKKKSSIPKRVVSSSDVLKILPAKCLRLNWLDASSSSYSRIYDSRLIFFKHRSVSKRANSLMLKTSQVSYEFETIYMNKLHMLFQQANLSLESNHKPQRSHHDIADEREYKKIALNDSVSSNVLSDNEYCFDDDSQFRAKQDNEVLNTRPNHVQTFEVSLGTFGNFVIDVYGDGFNVYSHRFKNTIEILSVDQPIIFVREHNASDSVTVIGDSLNNNVRCYVDILNEHGASKWKKSCALSTFSSSRNEIVQGMPILLPIQGENAYLCNNPTKTKWWKEYQEEHCDIDTFSGKIVLANRGQCMFYEKASVAQSLKATGLIVANTDDLLFIMSGKNDIKDDPLIAHTDVSNPSVNSLKNTNEVSSTKPQLKVKDPAIDIPVVMLTHSDAADLRLELDDSDHISITIIRRNAQLDSESSGYDDYPQVRTSKNYIRILSSQGWGLVLLSNTGKDWQLYLMKNVDINYVSFNQRIFYESLNSNRFYASTEYLTMNSVAMYSLRMSEQCSSQIDFKNGKLVQQL